MTKLVGKLLGGPALAPSIYKDCADHVLARDHVQTNNNVVGDTISLVTLKSTALIDCNDCYYGNDALGTGVTLSFGDATFPAGLRAANGASVVLSSILLIGALGGMLPVAPLWQRLGYATDPGGQIELLATIGGAAPLNGLYIYWQFVGQNQ